MLMWFFIAAVAVLLTLAAFFYFYQKKIVFYPTRDIVITPEELSLAYEEVYLDVEDGDRIHGWYFPAAPSPATDCDSIKTVLFCHGNAGNISHRFETITYLAELGVNQLIFDYRGYGRSSGSPSEANVYADATAAYRWLLDKKGTKPGDVVIFGRSLGGAVAIELASRVDCSGLIVESSFTSAMDMGKLMFPFVPVKLLLRVKFDSVNKISTCGCPVIVAHSPEDDLIPFRMGQELFERAAQPKQFVQLSGGHNERLYFNDPLYRTALVNLLCK